MNAGQRLRATYEFKPVDHMVRQEQFLPEEEALEETEHVN